LAVIWCIKAWNAPINQGNIDIAALEALATQATEIKLGTAKIATQALTDAGADDATIVTPKKLRWGFQILKGSNGYVVFPSWLGGLIIQWGSILAANGANTTATFPIAFPTASFQAFANAKDTFGGSYRVSAHSWGLTSMSIANTYTGAITSSWLAIGY